MHTVSLYIVNHASCITAGVGSRLFVHTLKGKWLEQAAPKLLGIQYMVEPRHVLTLMSKGQRSNPNPNPRLRVLTFAMGMGRDAEQRASMSIRLHICLLAQ